MLGSYIVLEETTDSDAVGTHTITPTVTNGAYTSSESGKTRTYTITANSGYYVPPAGTTDANYWSKTEVSGVTITYSPSSNRTTATVTVTWTDAKDAEDFNVSFKVVCQMPVTIYYVFTPSTITKATETNVKPAVSYQFNFPNKEGYNYPSKFTITSSVRETSNNTVSGGKGTIPVADMKPGNSITVTATYEEKTYNCNIVANHVKETHTGKPTYSRSFSVNFKADNGYSLPDRTAVSVKNNGTTTNDFTYDRVSGSITINNVKGDITIYIDGVPNVYSIDYYYADDQESVVFDPVYHKYTYDTEFQLPTRLPEADEKILDYYMHGGRKVTSLEKGTIGNISIAVYAHDDMSRADTTVQEIMLPLSVFCASLAGIFIFLLRRG